MEPSSLCSTVLLSVLAKVVHYIGNRLPFETNTHTHCKPHLQSVAILPSASALPSGCYGRLRNGEKAVAVDAEKWRDCCKNTTSVGGVFVIHPFVLLLLYSAM
jgi:hypothetical protein